MANRVASDEQWETKYAELVEYHDRHGHIKVPKRDPRLRPLYVWMIAQRVSGNANELSQGQRERLDELGFSWETRAQRDDRLWNDKFELLNDYKREYGDCLVSTSYKQDPGLVQWVRTQRYLYGKGELRADRIDRLQQLGFSWVAKGPVESPEEEWMKNYVHLVDFHREHGHSTVPPKPGVGGGGPLFFWADQQRKDHRAGLMSSQRKKLLDIVSFDYDAGEPETGTDQRQWDEMFEELLAFQFEHKGRLPKQSDEKHEKLFCWVEQQ